MRLAELVDSSPRKATPAGVIVELKPHQQSAFQRAYDLEKGRVDYDGNQKLETSVGILCDNPGAGKSLEILAIVLGGMDHLNRDRPVYSKFGHGLVTTIDESGGTRPSKTNLLVIPHSLASQWQTYIDTCIEPGKINVFFINRKKIFENVDNLMDKVSDSELVVVTSTYYRRLYDDMDLSRFKFARVFFDEADSLAIPACPEMPCQFLWFVTASYENLLLPCGLWERVNGNVVARAYGLPCRGFIKNTFTNNLSQHPSIMSAIMVKNRSDFVQASLQLPEINKHFIECQTSEVVRFMMGVVSGQVMQAIHAHDFKAAVQHLNSNVKSTEENIISVILENHTRALHNTNVRIHYVGSMHYSNTADQSSDLEKLVKERENIEKKIANITAQIRDADFCPICLNEFENKTVSKCCHNSFCFKCISRWGMTAGQTCPMCKKSIDINKMVVCVSEQESSPSRRVAAEGSSSSPKMTKVEEVMRMLNSGAASKRFLVLSQYHETFRMLVRELDASQIAYGYLKGNAATVDSTVSKYRDGSIRVLLINPSHYGCGLNLENTSDIIMFHKFDKDMEKQIIGRAHRCGRTSVLDVWYLLHQNER